MDRRTLVVEACSAGADVADDLFRTNMDVETKRSEIDYVTKADTLAQRQIIEEIERHYPDDAIVGEEEDERKDVPTEGDAWVIDPIDGTTNFVNGIPLWTTSVAAVSDGRAVAAANVFPALGERYVAAGTGASRDGKPISVSTTESLSTSLVAPILRYGHRYSDEYGALLNDLSPTVADFRRFGSAQTALTLVATGAIDATVGVVDSNPWDTVAGAHLVEAAGGEVTDVTGQRWSAGRTGIVATNGAIHDELLAVVQ